MLAEEAQAPAERVPSLSEIARMPADPEIEEMLRGPPGAEESAATEISGVRLGGGVQDAGIPGEGVGAQLRAYEGAFRQPQPQRVGLSPEEIARGRITTGARGEFTSEEWADFHRGLRARQIRDSNRYRMRSELRRGGHQVEEETPRTEGGETEAPLRDIIPSEEWTPRSFAEPRVGESAATFRTVGEAATEASEIPVEASIPTATAAAEAGEAAVGAGEAGEAIEGIGAAAEALGAVV